MFDEAPIAVRLTRRVAAPPERVFSAWLDPAKARRFLFATPDGRSSRRPTAASRP